VRVAAALVIKKASVDIVARHGLQRCEHWQHAFASQHKDYRYYEIVADTLHPESLYLFFALRDEQGQIQAIQPLFILDQDTRELFLGCEGS
jgi:hypothetical protein